MSVVRCFEHYPYSPAHSGGETKGLHGSATAGETISLSFSIMAECDVDDIEIYAEEFRDAAGTAASISAEVYIAKKWQISGLGIYQSEPMEVSELLLKDDRAPLNDGYVEHCFAGLPHSEQRWLYVPPDLRLRGPVCTSLDRDLPKQIWLSLKVSPGTASGGYSSQVVLKSGNGDTTYLPVELRIPAFNLLPARQDLLLFYRGSLDRRMPQYFVTPAQMRTHFCDIFDHGFRSIALQEQDDDLAQRAIDIAEQVGFDGKVLFQYPYPQNPQKLSFRKLSPVFLVSDEIDAHIKHGDRPADSYATNHRTNAQRARAHNWQTLSSLGDQRFVRRLQDQNDIGELPHILTLFLNTNKQYFAMSAAEPQERPTRTYYYWHAHMEKPNLHRVLAGLYLWKSKADGITPYCYQHLPVFPFSPYNDFDEWCPAYQHGGVNRPFRDQMVAYPAREGVVSTIQWEAMRDGITDLRYLTTLQELIETAATAGDEQAKQLANTAQKRIEDFLAKLPLHKVEVNHERKSEPFEEVQPGEYHQFRMHMQDSILELQALLPQSRNSSIDVRPSAPRVDIVIPAKNEEKHLGRLLTALSRQTYPADLVTIRVVDNGSTDGTATIARANGARVLSAEGYVSAVRNVGIREGHAELIGLLDADCVPVEHWIATMVQTFARPQIGVCAGSLQNICKNKLVKMFADRSIFASWELMSKCTVGGESSPYPWAMLGNAMIRRKAVEQAGLFDESLFRHEDVDLTVRLVQMGYQIACAPQASVQHFETDSPAKYLLKHARYGAGGARIAAKLGISGLPKFSKFDRSTAGRALQYLYLTGYWIERGKIAARPHRTRAQQFSTPRALPEFRQPFAWHNEEILALSDHMVFWHVNDNVVAVDMQDSRRFVFDGCACVIFDCLSDGLSRQATLQRLKEEFDCAPQEAASDLDEFIQQLIRENLLNQRQHAQILLQTCR